MARYAHEPALWYAGSGFDALHCPGSNEKIRTTPPGGRNSCRAASFLAGLLIPL